MQSKTAVSCFLLLHCSNWKFQLINFIGGTFEQKSSSDDNINDCILDKEHCTFMKIPLVGWSQIILICQIQNVLRRNSFFHKSCHKINNAHYYVCYRTGNCSVQRIPIASPDVASELSSTSHVRIKHAKELLDVDPKEFVYSGEVT